MEFELNDNNAEVIAARFKALGEPMRLKLLNTLRDGAHSVSELAELTGSGQANVSKHLQLLLQHGFVSRTREGTTSWYAIADPQVFTLCEVVCGGMEQDLDRRRQALRGR